MHMYLRGWDSQGWIWIS